MDIRYWVPYIVYLIAYTWSIKCNDFGPFRVIGICFFGLMPPSLNDDYFSISFSQYNFCLEQSMVILFYTSQSISKMRSTLPCLNMSTEHRQSVYKTSVTLLSTAICWTPIGLIILHIMHNHICFFFALFFTSILGCWINIHTSISFSFSHVFPTLLANIYIIIVVFSQLVLSQFSQPLKKPVTIPI